MVLLVKKVLESGTVCPQRHEASMASGIPIVSQANGFGRTGLAQVIIKSPKGFRGPEQVVASRLQEHCHFVAICYDPGLAQGTHTVR